ncbi:hypothetical protein ONZ43_g2266 [Nemania bipapillata]|uniref:Uncharacterized protein n=1 Tax=Nemania bipapillata TaxID=110536 RepID=A0ACC2J1A1_9PEZI|nr:hypothetical protein ONZ43_g2266 [Nemania bipapillata]
MARRPPAPGSSVLPQQTRQNEYFVPRDGIDREVITADICRYLGNDALNPENGQIIQGYFINAYRNLTSAMIQDLKADSARWDQERRQQSASRNSAGGVQYRNSDIHQSRQHLGPTESSYPGTAGNDPFDNGPGLRYPGSGTSGYTGAAGSYAQQYASAQGGYPPQGYGASTVQFSPPTGNVASYGSGHPVAAAGYGQTSPDPPYNIVGANLRAGTQGQTDPYGNDPYASRDPRGLLIQQQDLHLLKHFLRGKTPTTIRRVRRQVAHLIPQQYRPGIRFTDVRLQQARPPIVPLQIMDRRGTATNEKLSIATLKDMAIEPTVLAGNLTPES